MCVTTIKHLLAICPSLDVHVTNSFFEKRTDIFSLSHNESRLTKFSMTHPIMVGTTVQASLSGNF